MSELNNEKITDLKPATDPELIDRIQHTLNKIRPYIQQDGGDIEFVSFEDGIVTVRMVGACAGCHMASIDVSEGVEAIILDEIPEVVKVQLEEDNHINSLFDENGNYIGGYYY